MLWILAQTIILQLAFSFKVSWFCFCSVEVGKKTSSKKKQGSKLASVGFFNELFRILVKMHQLYKLRHVVGKFLFFSNWLVLLMRHNWLASLSNYVDS